MWLTCIQNRSPFGSRNFKKKLKIKQAQVQAANTQFSKAQSSTRCQLVAYSSDHVCLNTAYINFFNFIIHLGPRLLMLTGLLFSSISQLCQCLCKDTHLLLHSCCTRPSSSVSPVACQVLHVALTGAQDREWST